MPIFSLRLICKEIVVAMKDKDIQTLGTSADSVFNELTSQEVQKKLLKILVISENSSDIYMIKKFLPKTEGYIIHEAATLSAALKVMNYLNLDLVLVDDMLSDLDGYDIVTKLNHIDITKDIPKIILLTTDYKSDKKESFHSENLDFVKKPLDKVIFKLRVKSLIKNAHYKLDRKSYFRHLASQKFKEAQSLMNIYQEIFESSESILCIYDSENEKIVESNAIFEKFFLNLNSFNRIISNPRLARKFVPYRDEANYLNYYNPNVWMKTLIEGGSFSYLVKLQRDFKEYSFTIFVNKIMYEERALYLIKLSNIYDYLPQKKGFNNDNKLALKEKNLEVFKDDFLKLRELLWRQTSHDEKIDTLIYQLSTKLSIVCDDSSIVQEAERSKEINVYFTIVQLIKNKFSKSNVHINDKKVDKLLEENSEIYFANLDGDAITNVLFGLLNNYYGSHFNEPIEHRRLDITLYEKEADLIIEIKLDVADKLINDESLVDKIFHKKREYTKEEIVSSLPKSMKQSLELLKADIKKTEENSQSTYMIKMPL